METQVVKMLARKFLHALDIVNTQRCILQETTQINNPLNDEIIAGK